MMSVSSNLNIPESYKCITTVVIKGMVDDSDTVICTTDKRLITFFKGCLIKSCKIDIEVKHLEPFIIYEPTIEVYYILHGNNKVLIVKEGCTLEIIKTYVNVYEISVSDHNNSGIPQLYMRTDNGFECIDFFENEGQISNNLGETSIVYQFCLNKFQKLQILHDTEKNKLSQKTVSFVDAVMQVTNKSNSDIKLTLNLMTKNAWLKLSNENLVYGFTLQNTSKLPVSNFNLILLEDRKKIWSKFRIECWSIEKKKNSFNYYSGYEENSISNNVKNAFLKLNAESSIIVASIVDNWSNKSLPYFINGIVYINNENNDRITYIDTDEIMVTSNIFLDKELEIFVKNSVLIEDLIALHCTKLNFCYQIKSTLSLKDLKNLMVNNFKFVTKHEWFIHSSLAWLSSIKCYLDPITPFEFNLKVFSDSLIYTETFIQVLSTMLPEHTSINCTNKKVPNYINIDDVIQDLRELRRVFKTYMNEEFIIPRNQWNDTRLSLRFT